MNFILSPTEIKALAEQLAPAIKEPLTAALAALENAMKQTTASGYLTVKDVATCLQLSEKTIHKYINAGELRAKNLGTCAKPVWRVAPETLREFME